MRNPERDWEQATRLSRDEVESRVGPVERLEVLGGGLANAVARIDQERVFRLYRRDPTSCRKEARLLKMPWQSFRVPRVLEQGEDFLVLEFVPHAPLTREDGFVVGRALAEIHQTTFVASGFLGSNLELERPFASLPQALLDYALSQLEGDPLRKSYADWMAPLLPNLEKLSERPVLLHGDFKLSNLHRAGSDLLVLDWEFAYAGAALLDIGQLLRWRPPAGFMADFARGYGTLPHSWQAWAEVFDAVNLAALMAGGRPVRERLEETLAADRPESDLEFVQRLQREEQARRALAFKRAVDEGHRRGKEPFEYERFRTLSQLRDYSDPQSLEYDYYVVWHRLDSLEEFARKLAISEQYDGGDLGES
ncbi:MAG: phosphotransferase [Vulcanimicrobiota bacterium]